MGMTTSQIAHAFLVSEATMAQRIVRAKRKIVGARIPVPHAGAPTSCPDRFAEVLASLYIVFNEGYLGSGPDVATSRDLCADALWLCGLARANAARGIRGARAPRVDAPPRVAASNAGSTRDGTLVLLRDQDRSRWDHAAIAEAGALLEQARRLGTSGGVLAPGGDRGLPRGGADLRRH